MSSKKVPKKKKKNEIFKISHSNASSKSRRTFHHFKLKLIISIANMSISLKEIIKRFAG